MRIREVSPSLALPNGIVRIQVEDLDDPDQFSVYFDGVRAEILGASRTGLTVKVPGGAEGAITVSNGQCHRKAIQVGRVLNDSLHPVANPVVDARGDVYVTYSGTRGEKVNFGVFRVDAEGETQPFLADIVNPTGLAVGPDDCLYLTSRHSGEVYRSTFDKRIEKYVEGLGLATGLAFDSKGNLFVGDRSGTIYKVDRERQAAPFCQLEASISAFHIAVAEDDSLFVAGPTLATQDCVYRIEADGTPQVFFKGFGRPQGLGFDRKGRLNVAASYRGRKGLYVLEEGVPRQLVAGPMLVGFAYSLDWRYLFCADNSTLYRLELTEED